MSACSRQAVSQVGCRLMVASSAKISRPRLPGSVLGASLRTWARKASISPREDASAGSPLRFAGAGVRSPRSCAMEQAPVDPSQFRTRIPLVPKMGWPIRRLLKWRYPRPGAMPGRAPVRRRLSRAFRAGGPALQATPAAPPPGLVERQLQAVDQPQDLLLDARMGKAGLARLFLARF